MSLDVLDVGAGSPLLALHGFTGTARTWRHQVDVWMTQHRVIAPDLLGHGGSEAPTDPARYHLDRQAAELAELLRLLDAAPAAVVGYSMGARLALVLTLEHPQLVDRLVLESPSPGIADPAEREARQRADAALADELDRDGIEPFVDRWGSLPLFASQARLPKSTREASRAERLGQDPLALAASLRGAGQGVMPPLHDRLADVAAPTLVVAGALDPTGLERATVVARAIPDARLEVIDDAGHAPHLERPERFSAITARSLQPIHASHPR